jgi:hypothetical protein
MSRRRAEKARRQSIAVPTGMIRSAAAAAPPQQEQRRDITARTIQIRAASVNEQARTVDAVISTGGTVGVFDYQNWREIDEILMPEGMEPVDQLPMLANHSRWSLDDVLGSIRNIRRDGNSIVGTLHFAEGDEAADRAWNKVRQGHLTDISVGYRASQFNDIPAGQSGSVNGKTYTAGQRVLRITTKWKAREGSLVPIGADEAAKIREDVAPTQRDRKEFPVMNPQLRQYLESIGLRADATETEAYAFAASRTGAQRSQVRALEDAADASTTTATTAAATAAAEAQRSSSTNAATAAAGANSQAAQPPVDADAARAEGQRLERERQTAIRTAAGTDIPAEIVNQAINENWTPERSASRFLEHIRTRTAPAGIVSRPEAVRTAEHLSAALTLRAGVSHTRLPVPSATPEAQRSDYRERLATQAREQFGDISMIDICRLGLQLDGHTVPHGRRELFGMMQRAASTGALSNIFTTSMNASLLAAYEAAPDSTLPWTRQVEVNDFKTNDRILPGKGGAMQKLGRGGTAKDMVYGDTKESYKVARYAGKMTVDEQDVIDDNLGFIMQVPADMGEAARMLRPDLVYSLLLLNAALGADSVALFNSGHGNTATNALTAANLATGLTAMGSQTQNGRILNLMAAFLIVPQALKFTALQILNSAEVRETGGAATLGTANPILGQNIAPVVDNRLGVAGCVNPVTGVTTAGSATQWYLAAAPGVGKTIEVGVLRGTGGRPQVRSYVLSQGQWGMGWDVNLDIGAAPLDYRGLYRGNT